MRVLVIGANGQIGQHLVNQLQQTADHDVTAMVRKPEQQTALQQRGVNTVLASLEDSVESLSALMKNQDAVIFSAGSGAKTGPDKTILIDLDGAVKSVEAAIENNIQQFVMVSAIQAHNRDNWGSEAMKPYYAAKHYADHFLATSGLPYTIVRPGRLTNDPGTGKIQVAENIPERGSIPREDVAEVAIKSLTTPQALNKSFDMIAGDRAITDALTELE